MIPDERYKQHKLTAYVEMEFETHFTHINNSLCVAAFIVNRDARDLQTCK